MSDRIYVDAVINHMTGEPPENIGTAGNTAVYREWYYPAVPYRAEHFNWPHCVIDGSDYVNDALRVSETQIFDKKLIIIFSSKGARFVDGSRHLYLFSVSVISLF